MELCARPNPQQHEGDRQVNERGRQRQQQAGPEPFKRGGMGEALAAYQAMPPAATRINPPSRPLEKNSIFRGP